MKIPIVRIQAWMTALLLAGALRAQTPPPPADGPIQYNLFVGDATLGMGDSIHLVLGISNRTGEAIEKGGGFIDARGKLALALDWKLRIEQIRADGSVVGASDIPPQTDAPPLQVALGPHYSLSQSWSTSVSQIIRQPGAYRFVLSAGATQAVGKTFLVTPDGETPDWVRIDYRPEKTSYLLGEAIRVALVVANDGALPLPFAEGGDYRGASRHRRFAFTAVRDDGLKATDPHPFEPNMGGLGRFMETLDPGKTYTAEIDLNAYLDFSAPGRYKVSAYQALGFGKPVGGLESAGSFPYAKGGTFELELREPSEADVRRIIMNILASPDPSSRPQRLALVAQPAFLPVLQTQLERANDPIDIKTLVAGISAIEGTTSTRALIALADDARPAVRAEALQSLAWSRLPDPWIVGVIAQQRGRAEDKYDRGQRLKIEANWDESMRIAAVEAIQRGLHSDVPEIATPAIRCCSSIAEPALLPDLIVAADRAAAALPSGVSQQIQLCESINGAARRLGMMGATASPLRADTGVGAKVVYAALMPRGEKGILDEAGETFVIDLLKSGNPILLHAGVLALNASPSFRRVADIPWQALLLDPEHTNLFYVAQALKRFNPPDRQAIADAALKAADPKKAENMRREME